MKLQEKPYWIQLIVLALFMTGGLLLFSSLGSLFLLLIYHTPSMLEASDPVTAIRISQTFATIGTFLLPALLFAYCQDRQWFNYNAASRRPNASMTNIVLILSVTLLPVVGVLSAFNMAIMPQEGALAEFMRDLEEAANHILELLTSQRSSWDLISNLLVLAVLAHVGILLTAFIFSVLHFQFYGFIPRFALGVYLGYLFYWSRSLWLPILAHVLHNALSILVDFTLQGRGIDTDNLQFTDIHGSTPVIISCALLSAMGIVFLWRTHRDNTTR